MARSCRERLSSGRDPRGRMLVPDGASARSIRWPGCSPIPVNGRLKRVACGRREHSRAPACRACAAGAVCLMPAEPRCRADDQRMPARACIRPRPGAESRHDPARSRQLSSCRARARAGEEPDDEAADRQNDDQKRPHDLGAARGRAADDIHDRPDVEDEHDQAEDELQGRPPSMAVGTVLAADGVSASTSRSPPSSSRLRWSARPRPPSQAARSL